MSVRIYRTGMLACQGEDRKIVLSPRQSSRTFAPAMRRWEWEHTNRTCFVMNGVKVKLRLISCNPRRRPREVKDIGKDDFVFFLIRCWTFDVRRSCSFIRDFNAGVGHLRQQPNPLRRAGAALRLKPETRNLNTFLRHRDIVPFLVKRAPLFLNCKPYMRLPCHFILDLFS